VKYRRNERTISGKNLVIHSTQASIADEVFALFVTLGKLGITPIMHDSCTLVDDVVPGISIIGRDMRCYEDHKRWQMSIFKIQERARPDSTSHADRLSVDREPATELVSRNVGVPSISVFVRDSKYPTGRLNTIGQVVKDRRCAFIHVTIESRGEC
jgi:hypothetical protein